MAIELWAPPIGFLLTMFFRLAVLFAWPRLEIGPYVSLLMSRLLGSVSWGPGTLSFRNEPFPYLLPPAPYY